METCSWIWLSQSLHHKTIGRQHLHVGLNNNEQIKNSKVKIHLQKVTSQLSVPLLFLKVNTEKHPFHYYQQLHGLTLDPW